MVTHERRRQGSRADESFDGARATVAQAYASGDDLLLYAQSRQFNCFPPSQGGPSIVASKHVLATLPPEDRRHIRYRQPKDNKKESHRK